MKAVMLEGIRQVEVVDTRVPSVGAGEILVRVRACAICGTDVKMFNHGYAPIALPFIPGHELSGVVSETGAGVEGFQPGDRVAVAPNLPCGRCYYCRRGLQTACDDLRTIGVHLNGGFAEYVLIPAAAIEAGCVMRLPPELNFDEATLMDPASSVVNAYELLRLSCDDVVAVIGAGPTGCLGVEVARSMGVRKTILIQRSVIRLELAKFTNADAYVNSSVEDPEERIAEETSGRGADVVFVACGSGEAQQQSVKLVAKRGRISFFGGLPKDSPTIALDSNAIHYKEAAIVGAHGGSSRHCDIALQLIAKGRISAAQYIGKRVGIDSFETALALAEGRKTLKVVVDPTSHDGADR